MLKDKEFISRNDPRTIFYTILSSTGLGWQDLLLTTNATVDTEHTMFVFRGHLHV